MYKILRKERFNPTICLLEIYAPQIAKVAKPGQFIILRVDEKGERIPITLYDFDIGKGIISIIFQEVGKTTYRLGELLEGEALIDLIGPLGRPTDVKRFGRVLLIGGGVGAAEVYPIAKALKGLGNHITTIIGAKTKDVLILEEKMRRLSSRLLVATDDGSYGFHGFVSDLLKQILAEERFDRIFAIGPLLMMKAVSDITLPHKIKTLVSLNSNMVDGTGMCGTCRVTVGGRMRFTCVHGPEFDGHQVDFDELLVRQKRFAEEEKRSLELFRKKVAGCPNDSRCRPKIQGRG